MPFAGTIHTSHGSLELGGSTRLMGVLNITPDSFSDAAQFLPLDAACRQADRMLAEGADLLDIGGESTRPGAADVPADQQIARVIPAIQRIRAAHPQAILSVDTRLAEVAAAALDAGADIINDVSALEHDPAMVQLLAGRKVPVILMHMRGTPATMLQLAKYEDVVTDVVAYFHRRVAVLAAAGIEPSRMILDPGLGFAKNTFHNLEILRRLPELHALGLPILVGPSRKRFIAHVLHVEQPEERLYGTLAAVAVCAQAGVQIVRVHDVAPARQVIDLLRAIRHPEEYQ